MTSSLPQPPPRAPHGPVPVRPPGRAGVWVGVVIAVFGVVAAVVWAGVQFVLLDRDIDDLGRATAADPLDFTIEETVGWTLFLEPSEASLSGVHFSVTDTASGAAVTLGPYGGGFSYDTFSHSGRAVATVRFEPGVYRVDVDGPATIAIGPSPAARLAWMVGGGFLIGTPLFVGGVALALMTAVRDTRRRTQEAVPPPPSPWTSGEWPQDPRR